MYTETIMTMTEADEIRCLEMGWDERRFVRAHVGAFKVEFGHIPNYVMFAGTLYRVTDMGIDEEYFLTVVAHETPHQLSLLG